jgi:hypothetical protein
LNHAPRDRASAFFLSLLEKPAPGVADGGIFNAFYTDGDRIDFEAGLVPVQQVTVPPAMRELARRGPEALPLLIAHLGDDRPTRLLVGAVEGPGAFWWSAFSTEYDPKQRANRRASDWDENGPRPPSAGYTVKVGDVCYALIGEIVNRQLFAVRYQPSGGVVINSPLERPVLREEVEQDWRGATRADLEASLLADLSAAQNPYLTRGALERLRFYFPATYDALSGADLKKRKALEASARTAPR